MTGYGKAEKQVSGYVISVEIKSVNHRYFELLSRISRGYDFLEDFIRSRVKEKVFRGKIDVMVKIQSVENEDFEILVNHDLALGYITALRKIKEQYTLFGEVDINTIAEYKDIFSVRNNQENHQQIKEAVSLVLEEALNNYILMKQKEGLALKNAMKTNLDRILEIIDDLENRFPYIIDNYQNRLKNRIRNMLDEFDLDIDDQRVLTEVALFADKIDTNEEIVRLKSHLSQFNLVISDSDNVSVGRKLDFIIQEMNRESNTIGSKSLDLETTNLVIDIKSEIEKLREQVQNIE